MFRFAFVLFVLVILSCVGSAPLPCTQCGDVCVDLKVDSSNCGACGAACGGGKVCTAGACVATCPTGQKSCGNTCVDTATDRRNCGACAMMCGTGEVCEGSTCVPSCQGEQILCNGTCTNTTNDRANCGACGGTCAPGAVCSNSTCAASCSGAQVVCNGSCVDTMMDRSNCGGCGQPCGSGLICQAGVCTSACVAPLVPCNGTCVDPRNDPNNCNMCGQACAPLQATRALCVMGSCTFASCAAGYGSCDSLNSNGCETRLTSLTDCGACGSACAPANATGPSCTTGSCGFAACSTNFADCDQRAANGCETALLTNQANCGACNRRCASGSACIAGNCGAFIASFAGGVGDDVALGATRPRTETVLVGFEPGSFIHYTFDGTAPVVDAGTTRSAATPLVVANVDAGTLRWFAGFLDGGREPDEHRLDRNINAAPVDLGGYVENLRMSSTAQALGSPYVIASPGQTITVTSTVHTWRSTGAGYCPMCVLVPQLSVDSVGQVWCTGLYAGGAFPGTSVAANFTFVAPAAAGRYYLRHSIGLVFACNQVGGGSPVGVLIVR